MIRLSPALKDKAILAGWIIGLVLAGALLWSLTFSFRADCLMRSVNKILASTKDERVLIASPERLPSGTLPMGCWYKLAESDSLFYVFAVMRDGILVPFGAEVSPNGEHTEIIPLGVTAGRLVDRIPAGLIELYVRRIKVAAAESRDHK